MMMAVGPASTGLLFSPANASASTGNNGTIKIHEQGTPSGTESNDPKVCTFNIEGFGFDPGQAGYVTFDVQGGDAPTGVDAGPYTVGPANASGYFDTQYFNLSAGHYKATLYGKDSAGAIDLKDVKAKSKVFKVTCAPASVGATTASLSCELGGLLIHFTSTGVTPVAEWKVNGTVVVPDGSGNYLYPVAEDASYDVKVTADGVDAGHYTGTRDCVLGDSIVPANPAVSFSAPCGSATVTLTNIVLPLGSTGTAYTATVTAPGSNVPTQDVVVAPDQTQTIHLTYAEDVVASPIIVMVNGQQIGTQAVTTNCVTVPVPVLVPLCQPTNNPAAPYTLVSVDITTVPFLLLSGYLNPIDGVCPVGGHGGGGTGTITVIKHVINDNGGSKTAANFIMNVTGQNVSNTDFAGSENGVAVTVTPGAYSVEEGSHAGYNETKSGGCTGTIEADEHVICTITNNDAASITVPGGDTTGGQGGSTDDQGDVLGDSITPPALVPVPTVSSVLGASTTNLPVTGGNDLMGIMVAFMGAIGTYWITRRQMTKAV
ncbi:MAG: hypothetical protein ABIS59_00075 [Candidatus Saccharibacteria bacterium]